MWKIIKIKQERYICTFYRHIFHIYCEYIKYYMDIASLLGVHVAIKVLVKLLSADKSVSHVDIYSLLNSIFNSLWLIYTYNFLKFIQSHNTYSWVHISWIYATLISSEYHFVGVHRSNPF